MLTAIRLGHFKAFAETQRIPLRPLTLIYGANSSGKSSILHSLILARHALETGELDAHRTSIGGEAVDLGGFRQYIHRRDASRRMEWSAEIDATRFTGRIAELFAGVKTITVSLAVGVSLDDQDMPLSGAKPGVHSYEILADGKSLVRMSRRRDDTMQLDRLDHEHPVLREVLKAIVELSTTTTSIQPSDYEGLNDAIIDLVPKILAQAERFLPEALMRPESSDPSERAEVLFPVSRGKRQEDLAAAVNFYLPRNLDEMLKGIHNLVASELKRLRYLGPLRSYPPRHLAFSQHHDPNWSAGGGYAWDILRKDEKVRAVINNWLGAGDRLQTHYKVEVTKLSPIEKILISIENVFGEYFDQLDREAFYAQVYEEGEPTGENELVTLLESVLPEKLQRIATEGILKWGLIDALEELTIVDERTNTRVSHRDVGIGISQVIPVLVEAYASKDQIIAIEQPEIHLHPALQADLGDVFIESAIGGQTNRFIIETHSEHLLLRIMRRIRETFTGSLPEHVPRVIPNDVCVLFVEPDGSKSIVREMPLNDRGELIKAWPGGFFEEGLREVF